MIDLIRSEYGYSDEYILDKSFKWLYNSCELIKRRIHDSQLDQAVFIARTMSKLYGEKKDKLLRYDELQEKEDKRFDDDYEIDDDKLKSLGISKI
jgi:hypothetical protein